MLVLTLRKWPDKQDRQCTYTAKLRRFRAIIVAWGKKKVLHILSVCLLPQLSIMQSAGVLYFHMWPVWLYLIFFFQIIS